MGPTFDAEITNIPVEFRAATALFAGYVSDTTIRHNHIANTTYSGITLGWGCERILRAGHPRLHSNLLRVAC